MERLIVFHINVHVYIYSWGGNKPTAHAGITSTISGAYHNMLTYTTPDAAAGAGQGGRAELVRCMHGRGQADHFDYSDDADWLGAARSLNQLQKSL